MGSCPRRLTPLARCKNTAGLELPLLLLGVGLLVFSLVSFYLAFAVASPCVASSYLCATVLCFLFFLLPSFAHPSLVPSPPWEVPPSASRPYVSHYLFCPPPPHADLSALPVPISTFISERECVHKCVHVLRYGSRGRGGES